MSSLGVHMLLGGIGLSPRSPHDTNIQVLGETRHLAVDVSAEVPRSRTYAKRDLDCGCARSVLDESRSCGAFQHSEAGPVGVGDTNTDVEPRELGPSVVCAGKRGDVLGSNLRLEVRSMTCVDGAEGVGGVARAEEMRVRDR
jgi:hypothetical protein